MSDRNFTDISVFRDDEGIYDIDIDEEARDLKTNDGLETALFCSLFSDRRAAPDEVADPLRRRGWIGNLVSPFPGDNYGSGLWLYEQRRGTSDVLAGLKAEALSSLDWLIEANLIKSASADFVYDPKKRKFTLTVELTGSLNGISRHSWELWNNTARGQLATNS